MDSPKQSNNKNQSCVSATKSRPIRGAKNRHSNATPTRHSEEAKRPKNPNESKPPLVILRERSDRRIHESKATFFLDSSRCRAQNDEKKLDSQSKINPALDIFYKIAEIPHPSSHTKDLQKFLVDFLRKCDCKVETDSAGNIHALKGAPKLIFQAHYDMVLVGEKVAPFVEGGFLKSRDSSLGADNGIAVALLLDFAQKCDNFEILLTNDEEIGMLGANNLKLKTHSKTMINLDSECVNEICVGCAGGFDADISLVEFSLTDFALPSRHCENREAIRGNPFDFTFDLQSAEIYELSAQHFKGGHSGIDIDKIIKNAMVELLWTLESVRQKCEFRILEISGGEKRNSIPINAKAIIAIHINKSARSANRISPDSWCKKSESKGAVVPPADFLLESEKRGYPPKSEKAGAFWRVGGAGRGVQPFLRKEINESIEPNTPQIVIKKLTNYTPNPTQNPLNSAVIPHLLRLHNGIYEKSGKNITSSLNFSLLSNESLKIMIRANSAELLHRHEMRLKSLFGENISFSSFYNAWEESSKSPILRALQGLYDKHKIAHKIVQIHAGLECGILKEKCALHEVISIGPTIFHPHSKNEALDLESVGQIYDILCDLTELSK